MMSNPEFGQRLNLSEIYKERVSDLQGFALYTGDRIYDEASGLHVYVVNEECAVHLNDAGKVCYTAWRKNGCWTVNKPEEPTAANPFPQAETIYVIDEGNTFEGTIDQFRDCFFSNATPDLITAWCHEQGCSLETRPLLFHTVGYANKTAFHPMGSYIGFERGPTVFATALCYVDEAQEVVDSLLELIERQQELITKLTRE